MTESDVVLKRDNRIAIIEFNRPEALNAWTGRMEGEFANAVRDADSDNETVAIVVTGRGKAFCAGADLSGFAESFGQEALENLLPALSSGENQSNYAQRFSWLLQTRKPIIAALNGPTAGVGLCLALFCDIRFMSSGAKLTTAFARRGLIAEHGIGWMLPRLIGPMNALDLLLSARTICAEEAAKLGLVRILPENDFMPQVLNYASDIAKWCSPRSMKVIKRQIYDSLFRPLGEAWQEADREMQLSFKSPDFVEGVKSFLDKRHPHFATLD